MHDRSVVIIGLPESGKTTFLGALWHLVTARDIETVLRFHNLRSGDVTHLNEIAARWRDARVQERTFLRGNKLVSMNLLDRANMPVRVTFPDVAGEAYRRMWEERACDPDVAEILHTGGVLFFIHADTIRPPQWVVDETELSKKLGLSVAAGQEVPWHPRLAPTQVQAIGVLQLLREPPLDIGPRRLAIMLSAWDKVADEGLEPEAYLKAKLPMLGQYLKRAADGWDWRVYGISAQGGEYDSTKEGVPPSQEAEALRNLDQASKRIRLISGTSETHDVTEPLSWLME
jgi:hypothetical protein